MFDQDFSASSLNLTDLLKSYDTVNSSLTQELQKVAANPSTTNPGQFLLLQMKTSSLAQIGESISNIIANANSVIKNSIQGQRAGA